MMSRPGALAYSVARNPPKEKDPFPLLNFHDIVEFLRVEYEVKEEQISRPTSQSVRLLFEIILNDFMGLSKEYCDKAAKSILKRSATSNESQEAADSEQAALADDVDLNEFDTADSVQLLVMYRASSVLLRTAGINDFTLMDLCRPDPQRLRRILSAIIYFDQFREQRRQDCTEFLNQCDASIMQLNEVEMENRATREQIETLALQVREMQGTEGGADGEQRESTFSQLKKYNVKLAKELQLLQATQFEWRQEYDQYKEEKGQLIRKIQDNRYLIEQLKMELEQLKLYSKEDPSLLQRVIEDHEKRLQIAENNHQEVVTTYRNKVKTIQSIQSVEDDLKNRISIVQEILNQTKKVDIARDNMTEQKNDLDGRMRTSEEFSLLIDKLEREVTKSEEKIGKLMHQAQEKEHKFKEQIEYLQEKYASLVKARDAKEEKLDKVKAEINELDATILAMKNEYDSEVRNCELEVARLNAHIRAYISDVSIQL